MQIQPALEHAIFQTPWSPEIQSSSHPVLEGSAAEAVACKSCAAPCVRSAVSGLRDLCQDLRVKKTSTGIASAAGHPHFRSRNPRFFCREFCAHFFAPKIDPEPARSPKRPQSAPKRSPSDSKSEPRTVILGTCVAIGRLCWHYIFL